MGATGKTRGRLVESFKVGIVFGIVIVVFNPYAIFFGRYRLNVNCSGGS